MNGKEQDHHQNDNTFVIPSVKHAQNRANITCRVLWAGIVPNSTFHLMEVYCKYVLGYQE